MKKRILALLLVFAMLTAMIPAAAAATLPFTDVKESDWFYEHVDFVWSNGYFEGVSETEYDPHGTMTRAMFVTVLARFDEAKVDNSVSAFDDVPVNTWYTGSVTWAAENKIVDGVAEGKFNPNGPVTREQMCAIMDRYIKYYCAAFGAEPEKEENVADPFKDADKISAYAVDCVENCRLFGLVDGFEDGTFRPTESSTRAQVAAVTFRLAWVAKGETGTEDEGEAGAAGGGGGGGGNGGNGGSTPTPPPTSTPSPSPAITYTVTFNANGGSGTMANQTFTADEIKALTTNAFTRTGYTFTGWNTKADGSGTAYTDGQSVKNLSATLYAQWTPIVYSITYNLGGDNITNNNPATYTIESDPITLNPPSKDGYTFIGWTGSNGSTPELTVTIPAGSTGTKEYTANWSIKTYTITWWNDLNDDNVIDNGEIVKQENVNHGTTPTPPATDPTKPATATHVYAFSTWSPTPPAPATAPQTYKAVFTVVDAKYTIKWMDGSNELKSQDNVLYNDLSTTIESYVPTKDGYTFKNWTVTTNTTDYTATCTANWTPNTYKVVFDANGGTGTMSEQTFTYDAAQNLTANSFTLAGYVFDKWTTAADGSGDSYANEESVQNLTATNNGTFTLYAQWKAADYVVKFNVNASEYTGTMANQSFTYDAAEQALTANAFTRNGYFFKEWNTKADGTGTAYADKALVKNLTTMDEITLYAQWTQCKDYIGTAVNNAVTALQNNYGEYVDIAKDKSDNRFVDATSAYKYDFTFDFSPYIVPNGDTRYQTINAALTVAANFKRDAIINAAYYAGAAAIGTVLNRSEVKAFVDPYIAELNDWFEEKGIKDGISKEEREDIIDRVYDALKNKGASLWENYFKGEDGYYTSGITVTAAKDKSYQYSAKLELPDASTNRRDYIEKMGQVAKNLAIALTKEVYDSTAPLANDWEDVIELKGTLQFHFADSDAYREHTEPFPNYYHFTVNMKLDGNGIVFYKFVDHVPYVKLFIDQDTQDLYDEAVKEAVEKLVTNEKAIDVIRDEVDKLIKTYVDVTNPNNPFKGKLPAEITSADPELLNGVLYGIATTWFYHNSNISITNPSNDRDILDSYFYQYCWLGNTSVTRNDDVLTNVEIACKENDAEIKELAIAEAKKRAPDELSAKIGEAQEKADAFLLTLNNTIHQKVREEVKKAVVEEFKTALKNKFIEENNLDPINIPSHQTLVDNFVASAEFDNAVDDFVDSPKYNEAINAFIESPEYADALKAVYATTAYQTVLNEVLDKIFAEVKSAIDNQFKLDAGADPNKFTYEYYSYDISGARSIANITNWATVLKTELLKDDPNTTDLIDRLATHEVEKMIVAGDIPTSKNLIDEVTAILESHKYMEYIKKATNVRTFDSADDITLGNLATVLSNDRAQAVLKKNISDKNQSYLFKLAAQFDKVPESVSIVVNKTGTTQSFTIDYTLVEQVKVADTVEEICDALAAIFGKDGIKDLALSEFYGDGQTITFLYKTHSPSCVVCVEAE